MTKLDREITKNILRRSGWMFLVILFVVTSLGVGVAAFWQATHQNNDTAKTTPPTPPPNDCALGEESGVEKLPAPDAYKAPSKVDQLQVTDLQVGSGQEAKAGDCLVTKYYGTLASSGEKFDENFTKDSGLKLKIGTGEVIKGWDQGIVGMKVGGTRRLVIPASLGYGAQAAGPIPANSDLVFVVKLESIK
jgi:peptidylprolyl isomerase